RGRCRSPSPGQGVIGTLPVRRRARRMLVLLVAEAEVRAVPAFMSAAAPRFVASYELAREETVARGPPSVPSSSGNTARGPGPPYGVVPACTELEGGRQPAYGCRSWTPRPGSRSKL